MCQAWLMFKEASKLWWEEARKTDILYTTRSRAGVSGSHGYPPVRPLKRRTSAHTKGFMRFFQTP